LLRSLDLRSKGINLRQNWRRQYSSFYFHLHEDLSFNIFLPLYFSNLHSGKIAGIFLLNSSGWRQPTNFAVDIDVTYIVDKSNCFLISHHKFFLLGRIQDTSLSCSNMNDIITMTCECDISFSEMLLLPFEKRNVIIACISNIF